MDRQKEQLGGVKFGSAFVGWLAATGTAVLLTALLAAAGTALGVAKGTDIGQVAKTASASASTVGLVRAIALAAILGGLAGMRYHRKVDRTVLGV